MSGPWPPDWEDPDEVFPASADEPEADEPEADEQARLSEVSAFLASVPAPVVPDGVEARISAALAAEAAARAELGGDAPGGAGQDRAGPGGDTRPAGPGPGTVRPRRRGRLPAARRPLLVAASLVACLLFAGLGLALSRGTTSQSSSASAGSAAAPAAGSSSAAAGPAVAGPGPRLAPASADGRLAFTVAQSGTVYLRETLVSQVATVSAATLAGAGTPPSAQLQGCVQHVAGVDPELVDRASYQGTAAYVIASANRVWVVGLSCSAAQSELIVSVPRAG